MPFPQNRRNLIIGAIFLFLILPIILSLLLSKYSQNSQVQTKQKTATASAQLQIGPFTCPAGPDFCSRGQDVITDGTYSGFGAVLPKGNVLKAAFGGTIVLIPITLPTQFKSEKFNVVYLDNQTKDLRAVYYFKGEVNKAIEKVAVRAGDQIGKVGEPIAFYNNLSLVFQIIKGDPVKGEKLRLSSKDFK